MADADPSPMEERREGAAANRRTAPVFVAYLVVIVLGIAAAIALGLARNGDDGAAGEAVKRFSAAIRDDDGDAACALLSPQTRKQLEDQEGARCAKAILGLGLSGGRVQTVDVAETSAIAVVAGDGRTFLDEAPDGWQITAFGCEPLPDRPDACEVES